MYNIQNLSPGYLNASLKKNDLHVFYIKKLFEKKIGYKKD
jgi:hypothetical protein